MQPKINPTLDVAVATYCKGKSNRRQGSFEDFYQLLIIFHCWSAQLSAVPGSDLPGLVVEIWLPIGLEEKVLFLSFWEPV